MLRPDEQRGRWEDAGEQRACRRQGEALRLRSSPTVSVSQRRSGPARGPGRRRARASTGTAGTRRTAVQQTADGVTELGAGGLAMHYGLEQGEKQGRKSGAARGSCGFGVEPGARRLRMLRLRSSAERAGNAENLRALERGRKGDKAEPRAGERRQQWPGGRGKWARRQGAVKSDAGSAQAQSGPATHHRGSDKTEHADLS